MAVVVKDYVTSGSWAASYLPCFSLCSRRCRRQSPGRDVRHDGIHGKAGVIANVEEDGEEQLLSVKVSYVNSSVNTS